MKKLGIFLILLVSILHVPTASSATGSCNLSTDTLEFYARNNILYYCENTTPDCLNSYGVYGATIEEKIWTALTSFMTPEQAAGAMGNIAHEGLFNPAMHEIALKNQYQPGFALDQHSNISYGLGLIQWSFGRRIGLYNFIKEQNPDLLKYLDDYNTYSPNYSYNGAKFLELAGDDITNALVGLEIQYLADELKNHSSYAGFYNTTTVYDAAKYFLEKVERPRNPYISAHPERATDAEKYYDQFASTTIEGSPTCTASSDLQSLVLELAWPEYHSPEYLDRQPAYAELVADRRSRGRYVGGSVKGVAGIDCGGWVTTLVQESGLEPDYNDKNGATGTQENWVKSHGWTSLGTGLDAADLLPGDVAFTDGHTFIFVGKIEGFESVIASASYDRNPNDGSKSGRAPMAGHERISAARWYRKGN